MANRQRSPQEKNGQKDMTLGELLIWLRKRKQYRRRYLNDDIRNAHTVQRRCAVLFFIAVFLLSVFCMKEAQLHRRDVLTETMSLPPEILTAGNPALSREELTCSVNITVGTEDPFSFVSPAVTVRELLDDIGCAVGEDDRIEPSADAMLRDGMDIRIIRVTYEPDTVIAALPFSVEYIDSQTIPRDTTELISAGTDGTVEQEIRRRYENGVYAETEILSSRVLSEPVAEQQYRGVGGMIGVLSYSYYIDVTATAYGPTGNLTYTGVDPHEGIIAVDPTVIPLHTKCYITGPYKTLGICYAEDIGGGIKGNKIDVFMDADYDTLMEFGVREMRVYILD